MEKYQQGTCIYCGRMATTEDHVPPKAWFPQRLRSKMIVVPSCVECNNGNAKHEEHVRNLFAISEGINKHPERTPVLSSALRALQNEKQKAYWMRICESRELVDVVSSGGIYLDSVPGLKIDPNRIRNVISKVVKGLFFELYTKREWVLPSDHGVLVYFHDWQSFRGSMQMALYSKAQGYVLEQNFFECCFKPCQDVPNATIWLMLFYGGLVPTFWPGRLSVIQAITVPTNHPVWTRSLNKGV